MVDNQPTVVSPVIPLAAMTPLMHDAESPANMPDIVADGLDTQARLETLAAVAGWDGFTLLLLIAAWADRQGNAAALVGHLVGLATAGNG